MNFDQDIRRHILSSLPHDPADAVLLGAKPTGELLVFYINWTSRFVPARAYTVHVSAGLSAQRPLADAAQEAALEAIVADLRQGNDISPHLSRDVRIGFQGPGSKGKRRGGKHLDLLLNDWGIHHLHLSRNVEPDGFVTRTGPLLFAAFRGDHAYLVDVVPHGKGHPTAWTKQHVLETIVTEWPQAGLLLEVPGILASRQPPSDEERKNLRRNGYTTVLEYGDRVFMLGLTFGISSGGTSTRASAEAMRILSRVRGAEQELRARAGPLWEAFDSQVRLGPQPEFSLAFLPVGLVVLESQSRSACRLEY